MGRRILTGWLCLLVVSVYGCVQDVPSGPSTTRPAVESDAARLARIDLGALKAEKIVLTARINELQDRCEKLAKQVRDFKFINARQAEQIKAIADAPAQRDRYEATANALALKVVGLKKRVAALERELQSLRPSKSSRTKPAGE